MARVDQDVQEGLLEQVWIQAQGGEVRLKAAHHLDPHPRRHGQEPRGLLHDLIHVQGEILRRGRARVPEQVGERLVHPGDLGLDFREQRLPGVGVRELAGQNVEGA